MRKLRAWQQNAFDKYFKLAPKDFMAVATPGAGKTTFALSIARKLLDDRTVNAVVVVCPTQHLKYQWAEAAAKFSIHVDPDFSNNQFELGNFFQGMVVTYAQVASNPAVHKKYTDSHNTLVILDEIHHGGDSLSWGDGIGIAYEKAERRLSLTGTPFRSDNTPIPFVQYVEDTEGIKRSTSDYSYNYGDALRDGVVRPVIFMSYSGDMHWRTKTGEEMFLRLGEESTKDAQKQAWKTALDPKGNWIPDVLSAADLRLNEVRRQIPDAGGLIIASNQNAARAYAKQIREITGEKPTVVLSDDDNASDKIEHFSKGNSKWMVAVRMVSEGVDVPRLCVGVYATSACTPLFFAQAIGRFVRARKKGEIASIFLPSVTPLLVLASNMEQERDHALNVPKQDDDLLDDFLLERANTNEKASDDLLSQFEVLDSQAQFNSVLFDGSQFGLQAHVGSTEEADFLGIPGLLDPEQVSVLLKARQAEQIKAMRRESKVAEQRMENSQISSHKKRANLRKELSQLVAMWARRSNETHAVVHMKLRNKCGGPAIAQASIDEIQERIDTIRKWFVGIK
ncbi:DEAD/DEAH box helicase [Actinomyces sp. zg-332]|uniref:DEAD/DEAH box helicase n=1 Tax=Actinomyces sp. zg-332 TaxID=2708340 RepID=UPI0014228DF9|nr:DEAD/DEAH box helicase [Actinomyces sp. zg-332]